MGGYVWNRLAQTNRKALAESLFYIDLMFIAMTFISPRTVTKDGRQVCFYFSQKHADKSVMECKIIYCTANLV